MADCENKETSKKKGKRRQDDSEEESDEDSSTDAQSNASSESFDKNMEIPVEFEAFSPTEGDFNGIRCLLQQLFQKYPMDLSKLSDLIISQPEIATIIKIVYDDENGTSEDDAGDQTEELEEDVYGVTTMIDLHKHKGKETVKELKKFLVDKCRECASKETRREFEEVMDGQHAVGFLINERFINIPPQIAVPVYKTLRSELKKIHKKGQDMPIAYFVTVCKTYKDIEVKTQGKRKKGKVKKMTSALNFINPEDEELLKESQLSFSFAASTSSEETLVGGRWTSDDSELKPYRTVLLLSAANFNKAMESIHAIFSQ